MTQPDPTAAVERIRTYLRRLPNARTLGGEIAYSEEFRSEDWPRSCYAPTREDVETLLAASSAGVAPATDQTALLLGAAELETKPDLNVTPLTGAELEADEQVEPVCKFDEGCHRVVPCNPGCAVTAARMHAQLAAGSGDQTALRDRVADAVIPLLLDTLPKVIARARGYEVADAVLAVLPAPVDQAAVLREAAAAVAKLSDATYVNVAEYPRYDVRQRSALIDAAAELRRLAAEPAAVGVGAADEPTDETPYPPRNTWTFEANYEADKWHGIGSSYPDDVFDDAHDRALADFTQRAENDKQHRRFRMLRATTTYTVEAEHVPAAVVQAAAPDTGAEKPGEEADRA